MTEYDSGLWPLRRDASGGAAGGAAGVRAADTGTTAAVNGPRARS